MGDGCGWRVLSGYNTQPIGGGEGAMPWNFCAYCGRGLSWPPIAELRTDASATCAGCGALLYRNPDVFLLCLLNSSGSPPPDSMVVPLGNCHSIHETVGQLVARELAVVVKSAEPRLAAIVNDLDQDRVYLVFCLDAWQREGGGAERRAAVDWLPQLTAVWQCDRALGRRRVYVGEVTAGRLQLKAEG
jgi:hypothetical protein